MDPTKPEDETTDDATEGMLSASVIFMVKIPGEIKTFRSSVTTNGSVGTAAHEVVDGVVADVGTWLDAQRPPRKPRQFLGVHSMPTTFGVPHKTLRGALLRLLFGTTGHIQTPLVEKPDLPDPSDAEEKIATVTGVLVIDEEEHVKVAEVRTGGSVFIAAEKAVKTVKEDLWSIAWKRACQDRRP